jgi:hypothetical protein
MKCFFHHDCDAVALCHWCNRGLCPDCAVEVSDWLACRDRCESAVARAIHVGQASTALLEQTEKARGVNRLASISLSVFVLASGLLISAIGYQRWADAPMILPLGGVLVIFGLILGVVISRFPGKPH